MLLIGCAAFSRAEERSPAEQVDAIFQRVKAGDGGAVSALNVPASLPYLIKYVTDRDPHVIRALAILARQSATPANGSSAPSRRPS